VDRRRLIEALSLALAAEITSLGSVSGGDVHQAWTATFDDGRRVFAKTLVTADDVAESAGSSSPGPGRTEVTVSGFGGTRTVTRAEAHDRFRIEAADLAWLAETATVAIPAVAAVGPISAPFLALEWIDLDGPGAGRPADVDDGSSEARFGHDLARLHAHPMDDRRFGRADRSPTGSRRLPNQPIEQWTEFYRTQRLEPLIELASTTDSLASTALDRLVDVAQGLDRWIPADVAPSRLHGDLWAGNRLIDHTGTSWLIDPACFVGDREFDLAMMQLFGGFGPGCYAAYRDHQPLTDGWRNRIDLYQLAPLVVHAIKFGGPYPGAVDAALDRLGVPWQTGHTCPAAGRHLRRR
jgi:fructosamine-3-kinase